METTIINSTAIKNKIVPRCPITLVWYKLTHYCRLYKLLCADDPLILIQVRERIPSAIRGFIRRSISVLFWSMLGTDAFDLP